MVAHRQVRRAGGTPPTDASRLGNSLDDAPLLGFREREAGRPMAQVQGLAHLAFRERLLPGHQVGMHPRDRGRNSPCRAHLAPCVRQLSTDGFGPATLPGRRRRRRAVERRGGNGFLRHNLLWKGSRAVRARPFRRTEAAQSQEKLAT